MENWQMLLGMVAGGLIVPFVAFFKTKVFDQPFVTFLLSNGLAIVFGLLLAKLAGLTMPTNELILAALGIVGTASQGVHAITKTINGGTK